LSRKKKKPADREALMRTGGEGEPNRSLRKRKVRRGSGALLGIKEEEIRNRGREEFFLSIWGITPSLEKERTIERPHLNNLESGSSFS